MKPLSLTLAVVQALMVLTWTAYAALLPPLVERAGIDKGWVPFILLTDQVLFLLMDPLMGFAADFAARWTRRLGLPVLVGSLLSAFCFVAMVPLASLGPLFFGLPLLTWALSSSLLRAPTAVLLQRHAPEPRSMGLLCAMAIGQGLGGMFGPTLQGALQGMDPLLPFALASASLAVAVVGVVVAEMLAEPRPAEPAEPWRARDVLGLISMLAATSLTALGMQLHTFLRQGALLGPLVGDGSLFAFSNLELALGLFWLGFALAIGIWGRLFQGLSPGLAGALSSVALALNIGAVAAFDLVLPALLSTLLAGAAWAGAFASSISAALQYSPAGRAGLALGLFFASGSAMAALRLTGVAGKLWPGLEPLTIDVLSVLCCLVAALPWGLCALLGRGRT